MRTKTTLCGRFFDLWVPALIALTLLACSVADAVVRNVPSAEYPSVQAAIDAAADGDLVVVATGTYNENIDFKGKAITVRSTYPTRPDVVATTVIDGGDRGSVVRFVSGETAASVLRGFTIMNGRATNGGGVYCANASPTIAYNTICWNTAAGTYYGPTPLGGGVYCSGGRPTLTHNTITGNSASGGYSGLDGKGGGVFCDDVTLTGNTIGHNVARIGGGVYLCSSSGTISDNIIAGNRICPDNMIVSNGGAGAGVYCVASPTLTNNTITGNSATHGSGAGVCGVSPVLINNTVTGNWGTGVVCGGAAVIKNTIVAFNSQTGLALSDAAEVRYCDVYGNGGGDYSNSDQTGHDGNIRENPLFADRFSADFRLKSSGGRWNGVAWVIDSGNSPCIDAGDPASAYSQEPAPNGDRINMGADGNTAFASKSPAIWPEVRIVQTNVTYRSIQAAINGARSGQTIEVPQGTYEETVDFSGKAVTVRSTAPNDPVVVKATIVSGDRLNVITFNHSESNQSVLAGLTITGGQSGIYCDGSSPTITNNRIIGNRNGVHCAGGSSPTIARNTIADNTAYFGDESRAGVYCDASSPVITSNTITGNRGRGVDCGALSPIVTNNIISGNTDGGLSCSGSATVTNNAICGNSSYEGGGVSIGAGPLTSGGSPTLTNNTISGNSATVGGGIYCVLSSPILKNNIVAFNKGGGGLMADWNLPPPPPDGGGPAPSNPVITYCNFYGNAGGNCVLRSDPTGTNGNISVDPRFAGGASNTPRLKSRAGRWNGTAWVNDTVTSPCIDAGDPASPFANEPAPNGGRINMGYDGNSVHASKTQVPSAPTTVTIAPAAPGPEELKASATGSICAAGRQLTYRYHWAKQKADGSWDRWSYTGETLSADRVAIGETWRARAQASDGVNTGPWTVGDSVTIVSMAGLTPAPKTCGVPVTTCVFASFRWPVQEASVETRVQLKRGTTVIPTVLTWVTAERKVKLRPKTALLPDTYYRINLDPGIVCVGGRVLGWGENCWFKTAPAATVAAVSVAATPTAAGAQVTVSLTSAARVRAIVLNIAGRRVADLGERDLPAGVSRLLWNRDSDAGTQVPTGTYLVRVEAKGSEGEQAVAMAPLRIR